MAEAQSITGLVTAVNEYGFKIQGYEDWFNYSKKYAGETFVNGQRVEFMCSPWQPPDGGKVKYYANTGFSVGADAPHVAPAGQGPSPAPVQPAPVGPTPSSQPVAERPLVPSVAPGPAQSTTTATPAAEPLYVQVGVPTDISIVRQVCIKSSVESFKQQDPPPMTGDIIIRAQRLEQWALRSVGEWWDPTTGEPYAQEPAPEYTG